MPTLALAVKANFDTPKNSRSGVLHGVMKQFLLKFSGLCADFAEDQKSILRVAWGIVLVVIAVSTLVSAIVLQAALRERAALFWLIFGQIAAFLALGCGISVAILRWTRRTFDVLRDMRRVSALLLANDLRSDVMALPGNGDIAQCSQQFHAMIAAMRTLGMQIRDTEAMIAAATQELLRNSEQLIASIEEQSASISETSMNMESVAQTSQQISKNTDIVVQIAEKTRADAKKGMEIAEQALQKMHDIQDSNRMDTEYIQQLEQKSKEISKIMNTIVSIADQTKLIAFNASLEASGAGAAGRRFNVVAKEIRALADNVLNSTDTIRKTISDIQAAIKNLVISSEASTHNIAQGAEYTIHTTEWLQEILSGTTQTTRIAQRISRSLLKQQLASEEISAALKELVSNTEGFISASVKTSHVLNRLETFTKELNALLSGFKL